MRSKVSLSAVIGLLGLVLAIVGMFMAIAKAPVWIALWVIGLVAFFFATAKKEIPIP